MPEANPTPPRMKYEKSTLSSYNRVAAEKERVEREEFRRQRAQQRVIIAEQNRQQTPPSAPQKVPLKGGYILFYLVLGLAIGKDLIDIFCAVLDAAGTGLSLTIIGSVIGIPLAVFSEVLDKLATFFLDTTMMFYFWYTGGKLGRRLVIMSIGAIIDAVPLLNALPITTLTFVLAFLAGRVANKVPGAAQASSLAKKI